MLAIRVISMYWCLFQLLRGVGCHHLFYDEHSDVLSHPVLTVFDLNRLDL